MSLTLSNKLIPVSGYPVNYVAAVAKQRGYPRMITVDNGSEFASKALDTWAYAHTAKLNFIRPGKPVENAVIESFNGRFRDER